MSTFFDIGGRRVGPGSGTFVIAEIAQAHDGSLGTAHAYIDAVARAGAQAIKFQTHIAQAESTPGEPFRVKFSRQDATRYDYWKRMEFTPAQWAGLAEHAREQQLVFLSSAFSPQAVDLLAEPGIDMAAWKVGSGEVTNLPLLERMARTKRPVLLSSGLSDWADLDRAAAVVRDAGAPVAIFQCTTAYPCPPEKVGLNVLAELRARYACPVGLSDHSGTIWPGVAAATLGAELLELHVTFSKEAFGPDVPASVTLPELAQLVDGIRFVGKMNANPVDKAAMAGELAELKTIFGKSVVVAHDLPAGHVLGEADLAFKKPGTGIPAARWREVVGKKLARAVAIDTLIGETDLV
jgi:N,N'-diacetyllegionaminate synthase